jgi:hypothetical protein
MSATMTPARLARDFTFQPPAAGGSLGEDMASTSTPVAVDLYRFPLGASGHMVRWNGNIYEAIRVFIEHRRRAALYP